MRTFGLTRPKPHRIGKYGPFLLHGEFTFSDFVHWGSGHNRAFERCIAECRGKACVLDIGAHIGLVALPMSQVVATRGQVHAFEPSRANLDYLCTHLELNNISNVTVVEALVGNRQIPAVKFYEQPRAAGQNSIVIKKNAHAYRETLRQQITLDEYCQSRGLAPDVIKIDVEGSEIAVLEGARNVLAKYKPTIFLSVHPEELRLLDRTPEELRELIHSFDYDCRDVEGKPVMAFRLDEYVMTARH